MFRFLNRRSIFVRISIKWSRKLLKVPQPIAEAALQKALASAVGTEFEIESENEQLDSMLPNVTNSQLILLFT